MAFIGKQPKAGNFILLDSITTSATATFNLTRNSTAYFPASARNLIVSLNGVTQAPDTAYSVSGSTIVFASALTSNDSIDYILVLGDVLSIGTPADNTVGETQLSYPLTNFSSTGIDDNADATAITINSSEQVGIGGSPSAKFQVKDGHNGILIGAGTHDTHGAAEHIQFNRGSSAAALASIGIENSSGNTTNGRLMVSSREGIIFNTGGANTWKQTSEIARMTTAGLCFNGDTAAANALDDYEEGTWTPTITSGVNSISYNARAAHYIKIGHQVFCDFYINYSGTGSGAQFIVSSLPYTQKNVNYFRGGGCSTYQNLTSNTVQFYGSQGTIYFYCYVLGSNTYNYSGSISSKYLIGTFSYISA